MKPHSLLLCATNLEIPMIFQANKLPSIDFLHFHFVLVHSSGTDARQRWLIVDQRTSCRIFSLRHEIYFALA